MSVEGTWKGASLLVVVAVAAALLLTMPLGAGAHGAASSDYTTTIDTIEPAGLPIEARIVGGDQLRIENVGDEVLTICGYLSACEAYARLSPKGVFVNENSAAYFANLDAVQYGDVPDDAGTGKPKWVRVRREPAFLEYHDHRVHWMGGSTLPPGVDPSSSKRQKVTDAKIDLTYGDTPVTIRATLYYVGGASFIDRFGEYILTGTAVALMLLVFVRDARRRRRLRPKVDAKDLPQREGAIE